MKGKIVSVGLAVLLTASTLSLAACKEEEIEFDFSLDDIMSEFDPDNYVYNGEPCTITMAHWDSAGPMEEATTELVVEAFEKRYPTINVELDIISDYANTYSRAIASGNVHDVFMVSDGEFRLWSEGGIMQNLKSFLNSSTLLTPEMIEEDMLDGALERYESEDGTLMCFPKDIGPQVLYYNKDIFDRLGVAYPPSDRIMTLEEATQMWKDLTVKSGNTTSVYGLGAITSEGLVWSAGGDFLNDDRTAFPTEASDVEAIRQAYTWLQNAVVTDGFVPSGAASGGMNGMDLFCAEMAATIVGGRWEISNLRTMDFNWDVAYVPAFPGENMQKNYWSGSVGYAMYNKCEHKEAAWKLIEYIGSPEGQTILAASGFSVPIYESVAYADSVVAREKQLGPQNYDVFIESAKHQPAGTHTYRASQRWLTEGYNALAANLYSLDESARWTIEKFMSELETKVNSLLV